MAKIKLPKNLHGIVLVYTVKKKLSRLSSQADAARENRRFALV